MANFLAALTPPKASHVVRRPAVLCRVVRFRGLRFARPVVGFG